MSGYATKRELGRGRSRLGSWLRSASKWRNAKGRETRPFGTIKRLMLAVSIVLVAAG
jgi:hypothetical protein